MTLATLGAMLILTLVGYALAAGVRARTAVVTTDDAQPAPAVP